MDVQDLKLLFEMVDVKAQSKSTEDPFDANLRRFKDRWLFIATILLILLSFIGSALFIACRPDSPHLGLIINSNFGLVMGLAGYYVRGK